MELANERHAIESQTCAHWLKKEKATRINVVTDCKLVDTWMPVSVPGLPSGPLRRQGNGKDEYKIQYQGSAVRRRMRTFTHTFQQPASTIRQAQIQAAATHACNAGSTAAASATAATWAGVKTGIICPLTVRGVVAVGGG